ncbi:cytochrome c oxidase assembly protein [Arthrobacter sp. Sa2BUA2]|uniref:Cytochrome c oxidase assembly protein n=1 Tax=Arthrobacter pullicola TaxID=2762224 RepID=A0ABR8YM14_9MICC|nr:cytochrome c oxidase assembly protein [Arthrobacter pullicola]MBD8045116.1 cytochrome c oxidase assembly protein [Arthrobacter pullicola]
MESLFLIPAVAAVAAYWAGTASAKSGRWPARRLVSFIGGVLALLGTLLEPLAGWAHRDFTALAFSHILAGMVSPLLLVVSRPAALALQTLDPFPARRLRRILEGTPARFLSHPWTATVLVVAGMWAMFHTGLFTAMQDAMPVHWLTTAYLAGTGCLFTAAVLGTAPVRHSFRQRAAALVVAATAHAVLAAGLWFFPPPGVAPAPPGALVLLGLGATVQAVLGLILLQQRQALGRQLPQAHET